jgi:predicted enzyme related to lactoylglutathione lyase
MATTPSITWTTITLDCSDAEVLAAFYSRLFGWDVTARDGAGWVQLRNPQGGVGLNLQAEPWYQPPVWPEQSGHQTKMIHLEVMVDDLDAAERLVIHCDGVTAAHQPADRDPARLRIMLDPAGHPFCLFVPGG